ncbi:MAG TPA: phosphoribosyltransferase [Capsulimonadaceae bacterium]|jgi:phosphoribosylpyrophosphate synthetase
MKMIFLSSDHYRKDVVTIDCYYPTRFWTEIPETQCQFSKAIIRLKENDDDALRYFYSRVEPLLGDDFTVVVIPPHEAYEENNPKPLSGVSRLALAVARVPKNRVDGTTCLRRVITVQKKAFGGNRSEVDEMNSIRVFNPNLVSGRDVLLIDDVRTSGCSINACRHLLMKADARDVRALALGQTTNWTNQ